MRTEIIEILQKKYPEYCMQHIDTADEILRLFSVVGQSEQLVCPECKSTDCKTAIHTDYKECNKCYYYWEAS